MPYLTIEKPVALPPKAPQVIGPKVKRATRPTKEIPQFLIDSARETEAETWDAGRHLSYQPPTNVHTMKDIGLEGHGISPVAVTDPFPLFTEDAMLQMRREIFSDEVLQDCQYGSDFIANMVRGMGPK